MVLRYGLAIRLGFRTLLHTYLHLHISSSAVVDRLKLSRQVLRLLCQRAYRDMGGNNRQRHGRLHSRHLEQPGITTWILAGMSAMTWSCGHTLLLDNTTPAPLTTDAYRELVSQLTSRFDFRPLCLSFAFCFCPCITASFVPTIAGAAAIAVRIPSTIMVE
jgi:hypothetical protein